MQFTINTDQIRDAALDAGRELVSLTAAASAGVATLMAGGAMSTIAVLAIDAMAAGNSPSRLQNSAHQIARKIIVGGSVTYLFTKVAQSSWKLSCEVYHKTHEALDTKK